MEIAKILSNNDTGESGGHQDGFHIPKNMIHFFPDLASHNKNPRMEIIFKDSLGQEWIFNYIHYNNKFFGGTRNEYRLTRTAGYIKTNDLKSTNTITLSKGDGEYFISYEKTKSKEKMIQDNKITKIVISNKWKVIKI